MTNDLSIALAELQLDPGNDEARRRLAERASNADPADVARALTDARRWHREHSNLELCVELLDLELSLSALPERRADLLHEKGRLLDSELLQSEAAMSCFNEALKEVPGHANATEALSQLSLVAQNWEPISARYLQSAEEAADPQLAASLIASAAELVLKYKNDQPAGEALLKRSLALDPRNRAAGGHLERLLRRDGRIEELFTLFVSRAENAESREARAAAEVAAGQLASQLGRGEAALEHFRRALNADPAEPRALRIVAERLTDAEAWPELIKVYEAALKASRRGESDVALLVQLGMLLWRQLGKPEDAELYFRRVRKVEPANEAALSFYREYHTARNELPQFLAVLAQAQKAESDPERRVRIGIEMARAAEQRPGNLEKVIDIWKGLLRLRPHLPEAVQSLRRLYTQTQKWNALLELLKDDLEAISADAVDEKVARHLEIAAIYRDHLNLDVMVVNTYMSILAVKPDHPVALAALAERYEAQGRWSDLIQVLTRQADGCTDQAQRVALYRRIATLWVEKFGKSQNALNALERILEAEPDNADARERLKELYAKSRAWRPLLEVYKKELPFVQDAATRRSRLGEMARIASERLSDAREAIALWNQALELDENDSEALQALANLYDHERRWAGLAEVLRRQERIHPASDTQGALALLERLGSLLHEKLGASAASVDVWKRVQAIDPRNARAIRALREIYAQLGDFDALEALYAEQGAFEDLCETLTSVADRTSDVALRTRLLERVAALSLERLHQPERALKSYERILATEPQNRAAALALVPLYRDAEKWPRLLATYEILLGYAPGSEAAFSAEQSKTVLRECREVCEQRLGSKALAFQWCARAYQLDPTDAEVLSDLERLAVESDEWSQLATLFAARLSGGAGEEERLGLLRRQLRIWLGRLYRPEDARRTAEAILAVAPGDDEAETALEQIFTQSQSWTDLRDILLRREARATDSAERLRLLNRLAQLEEEKLGDLQSTAGRLQTMSEMEPTNERTLRWLGRTREALEDWTGLIEVLRREASLRAAGEKAETLLRIAELEETKLLDSEATFETLRDVLALDQLNTGAIAGLERLQAAGSPHSLEIAALLLPAYERTENNGKMAATLEVLAAAATDDAARIELLERLQRLYADVLKDAGAAYRIALRLFELQPTDRPQREALIQLALEPAQVEEVAGRMRVAVEANQDAELRRDLLVAMAELYEQRLGRVNDAESVYCEVLKVESTHVGAFRALSRLYRDTERWSQLRSLIEERQALVLNTAERLDLLAQVAEIDETVLEDLDHAIDTYQRMLDLDPSDRRAHRALDRHYTARERWRDLEELLAQEMAFVDPTEVPELLQRRAEIRAGRFDDIDGAIDLLQELLAGTPQHEGARRLLERQLSSPEHKRRVAALLAPVYESAGAWSRLVGALEIEREFLQGVEAAKVLARIADLQEHRLQARAPALQTWRQALLADPAHLDALTEIERLAGILEQHQVLVDVYQELAFRRDPSDIAGRADLLGKAARLLQTKLKNRRGAVEVWKLVLNLDVNNLETARPAANALEKLYTEIGDNAALARILHQQSVWAEESEQRCALLFRAAELEEKFLKDVPAAVGTLRSILEIDNRNGRVLDELERIFEAGGQHKSRIEVLRRRISQAESLQVRQELRRRIADIFDSDLNDLDEAVATCIAILDESPEDLPALDALAGLYERQNRHVDRLGVLERRLPLTGQDRNARVEILRQIGGLLAGPLGNPPEALERWREILSLQPGDSGAIASLEQLLAEGIDPSLRLQAAQALEPVYEASGRWADLARVVQIYIDAEDDPRARSAYLVRLASLRETHLGDLVGAFDATAAAVRDALSEPNLGELLDQVERIGGADRVADIVTLYREIGPDVLDEALRMRLERTVAEQARRLGQTDVAIQYQRRLLERVPDDAAALCALEEIYREQGDKEALYDILGRRAELCADPQEERRLRMLMGELAEGALQRREDAVVAYERVLELYPGDDAAAGCLDRIYAGAERWTDLVGLLERQLRAGISEREAVVIHFRLAELHSQKLHDNESALAQLRSVLDAYREHDGAIAMLETMLEDVSVQCAAAELLDPVYVGRQDWAALIKIDEIRLRQADDPGRRLAWTQRIARLYEEQMEDLESALKWYGKVFQELPTERSSLEQLLRLAEVLGRWAEVGQLLASYLAAEFGESDEVLNVVRAAAEIFDHHLGDRAEARRHYRRLVEARPDQVELSTLFENALERWEAWQELRELLDERAGRSVDAVERKTLMRRSARLDEERLNDRSRAIETLKSVLAEDPEDRGEPTTASELERLYRLDGRWQDLAELLISLLDHCDTPLDREAVLYRLAEVLERRLEDLSGATDRYAELLQSNPRHGDAVAAMERLLVDAGQRPRVATVLEPVYRTLGDWTKLINVLEAQLETVQDASDRVRILGEVADLHQRLSRLDLAFDARARAWLTDVSSPEALSQMESLGLSARAHGPLVQALQKGAEVAGDPELQARLHSMAARLLEEQLSNPTLAIEEWRAALSACPDLDEAFIALERLLSAAARTSELVEVLEDHLGVTADAGQRKDLARRMASLYETALKQRERAIAAWQTVLEIDPSDMEALDALVQLFSASLAWRDLAGIYLRKIELVADAADRRGLRLSLSQLYDEKLNEAHEAVLQLRSILDESPSDSEALVRLDAIYTREAQHAELLEVLDMRVGAAGDAAEERDALAFRAAQLVQNELSDVSGAIGRYRDILTRAPQHQGAREALWSLARGEDYRAQAVEALEPVLRSERDWGGLVELLELRIGSEDAGATRLELLGELARIEEEERRDSARAFAAWARAFTDEPNEPGVRDALERLTAATGDFTALARVYEDRLEASFDAGLQRSLAIRLAELQEEKLGSPERAADFLRKALELVGDEGPVLASLERVLRKLGSYAELSDVLLRQAENAVDPAQQAEFWASLGYNRLRQLSEPESALAAFRDAVERAPEHPGALAALHELLDVEGTREGALDVLEPLAERRGDFQQLVALYERRLALQEDRSGRAQWLRRMAEVWEQRLGQPQQAIETLGRALKEEPSLGETVDELERIAAAAGMPGDAAGRIAAVLDVADAAAVRELALKAGSLYAQAQDRASAERLYMMVLDQDSESTEAMQALEAIYRASEDNEKLCSMLERRAGVELEPSARRALLAEAAALRERTGAVDLAIEDWQAVRREMDGDAQALGELARLFEGLQRLPELCEVLEERARFADDGETRAAFFGRIGDLKLGQNDLEGAAEAFREALDGAPQDPRLLTALEQVEEKRGDWSTLQEVLLRRLTASAGPAQAEVLFKLAKNAEERLEDREQAAGFLHQVLGEDPSNRAAFAELKRILTSQERWYDLIDVLGRHADVEASAGDVDAELKLRVAIADVWEQKIGSPDAAAEALEKVLERAPENVAALLSLARLHEASDRLDDAVAALQRASAAARAAEEIADIQYRTGALMEKQGAPAADVEAAYARALQSNPKHRDALAAVEKIARDAGDSSRLSELLQLRLSIATDAAERQTLLTELVALCRGPLAAPGSAVSYLEQLVALSPDDVALQEELADVQMQVGRLEQASEILAQLIDKLTKARRAKETARFQQRLGALCEKRGDLNGAAQRFNAAYQVDPSHAGTLAALGRLALQQNDVEKARRYYRSLLLQNFDPQAAGITKAEIYLALGKTHLQSNEMLKARNMFERGLECDPKHQELKDLVAKTPRS